MNLNGHHAVAIKTSPVDFPTKKKRNQLTRSYYPKPINEITFALLTTTNNSKSISRLRQ